MSKPVISIIIPVYNVSDYVAKSTESLMVQTFEDVEFIFVDDATPDNSIEIIKSVIAKYPNRLERCHFIHHSVNRGLTASRNSGLEYATGDYVLHVDSDDWMEPSMIDELYSEIVMNGADIVYSDFWMEQEEETKYISTYNWDKEQVKNIATFITEPWTVVWNMLVRRELYINTGIRSLEELSFCEDFNLSIKLLLESRCTCHIKKALYHYNRNNSSSITHIYNRDRMLSEQKAYSDVAKYMDRKGVYSLYVKEMSWRFLRSKDPMLIQKKELTDYLTFHPESHAYICSCPYLSIIRKVMAWCLTHHLKFVTFLLIDIRTFLGKGDRQ